MPPSDQVSKQPTAPRSLADAQHPDLAGKPSAVERADGELVKDRRSSTRFLEPTVADLAPDAMLIDDWSSGINATRDLAAKCETWANIPIHSRRQLPPLDPAAESLLEHLLDCVEQFRGLATR